MMMISIGSLNFAVGLSQLNFLRFAYNPITDISPLVGLTGLDELLLGNTGIADIKTIVDMNKQWTYLEFDTSTYCW